MTPQHYIDRISHALETGVLSVARRLSHEGARLYPDNHDLRKYARVLAPPRLVRTDLPPNPSVKANRAWLKQHADAYRGHWVGLRNGALIAVANSYDDLVEACGETKGVLLTKA